MKKFKNYKLKFLVFAYIFYSNLIYAELNNFALENLNQDYKRITRLREEAQPARKSVEILINEKNKLFVDLVKTKVEKEEFEIIKKDINTVSSNNFLKIEEDYLEKIDSTKDVKLIESDQELLTDLINSTNSRLQNGVDLDSISKNAYKHITSPKINLLKNSYSNTQLESIETKETKDIIKLVDQKELSERDTLEIEAAETKRIQTESLIYSKRDKKQLISSEEDSLFTKVSKAYLRNLEKIILEDVDQKSKQDQ